MNKNGKEFVEIVREIVDTCNEEFPPERRARGTAFNILMMMDGSGEFGSGEQKFKVVTMDGQPVEFFHHDL